MRPFAILISLLLLFIPTGFGSATGKLPTGVIVLTADQVHTAGDIEYAFHQATGWGTHPGMVVLDGSRGIFQYDSAYGQDFDINIFYSDLRLRGENNAVSYRPEDSLVLDLPTSDLENLEEIMKLCKPYEPPAKPKEEGQEEKKK